MQGFAEGGFRAGMFSQCLAAALSTVGMLLCSLTKYLLEIGSVTEDVVRIGVIVSEFVT